MSLLAYPIALFAALPTTLAVLALWVGYARVVNGDPADSVFLALVFLFVPLVFFVSVVANLVALLVGRGVALVGAGAGDTVTIAAAGVLVVALCAWTQRGGGGMGRTSAPVSPGPVLLFALTDMTILAGGLSLLPRNPIS
ncbi:hypothetical protein [Sphingomonas sp. RS2018]